MNSQSKLFGLFVVVLTLVALILPSRDGRHSNQTDSGKLKVVTTLFPFYDFARAIGGQDVEVTLLLPPGVEAHDFEPKPSDVRLIAAADIFAYTSAAMEPWVQDVLAGIDRSKLRIVDASHGINMIDAVKENGAPIPGTADPHFWLNFNDDKVVVDAIASAMAASDNLHAENYQTRAEDFKRQLTGLDQDFASRLRNCSSSTIVFGGHYAFGYLAARYGLNYIAAQGMSPDAEPTARELASLVELVRANEIATIYYEELESPRIAQTISSETGAQLVELNSAHNVGREDLDNGVTFVDLMQQNLEHIAMGQRCMK